MNKKRLKFYILQEKIKKNKNKKVLEVSELQHSLSHGLSFANNFHIQKFRIF